MPGKTKKVFQCNDCLVVFEIEVEPTIPESVVEAEYPQSIEWLDNVKDCPICGTELEER